MAPRGSTGLESFLELIGDGAGQAGFNAPTYSALLSYYYANGVDAPEAVIIARLRATIDAAQHDPDKSRAKYDNDDSYLSEQADNARHYVTEHPNESARYGEHQTIFDSLEEGIAALNCMASLVIAGGKSRVALESIPEGKKQRATEFLSISDARVAFAKYYVKAAGKPKGGEPAKPEFQKIFDQWLGDSRRREYFGETFAPDGKAFGKYNTWKGLAVDPNPDGSWHLLKRHLLLRICAGDADYMLWLMSWFAQPLQQPTIKMGSALVVDGSRGDGKSTLGYVMKQVYGQHQVKVTQSKHLTGPFNAHLAEALMIMVEEAFWAGDHAAQGALKDMITADTIQNEDKGRRAFEAPDYSRQMHFSQPGRIIPASADGDERRFFCLTVPKTTLTKDEKREYFIALYAEIDAGAPAAMLASLLDFDFTGVDLRQPPVTELLLKQVAMNLNDEQKWFVDCVTRLDFYDSELMPSQEPMLDKWETQPIRISADAVFKSYEAANKPYGSKRAAEMAMSDFLCKIPGVKKDRPMINGKRRQVIELPSATDLETWLVGLGWLSVKSGGEAVTARSHSDSGWSIIDSEPTSTEPRYLIGREMEIEATLGMVFSLGEDWERHFEEVVKPAGCDEATLKAWCRAIDAATVKAWQVYDAKILEKIKNVA